MIFFVGEILLSMVIRPPNFLERLSTDEYKPVAYSNCPYQTGHIAG
jgi:hypothetical protein